MFKVVKRDGEVASFNIGKITNAIEKAFKATDKQFNTDIIELLGLRVTADFQNKIKDSLIDVESIQDSVETVLEQSGYSDVAKAYILYRKHREKIRNMKSTILDYKDIVNSYVKVEDWRVKENSTVTYSVGGLILSNSGAVTAYPRPLHADRLLCRLVLKAADPGGLRRHRGKNHLRSGQASVRTLQPDGEFPWNHAE